MSAKRSFLTLAVVLIIGAPGRTAPPADPWAACRFLLGEWVGEGEGQPGRGTGGFTFALELQDKVMVRRNRAELPATAGRPAAVHEDLMVVYRPEAGQPPKAIYFDNEGHVIQYNLSVSADQRMLTFLSDPQPSGPRFRLSYTKADADSVTVKFEIAPPGKPDEFKTYLEGKVHRKGR